VSLFLTINKKKIKERNSRGGGVGGGGGGGWGGGWWGGGGGGGVLVQKKRLFLETEAVQQINPMIDLPHATSGCFVWGGRFLGGEETSHW